MKPVFVKYETFLAWTAVVLGGLLSELFWGVELGCRKPGTVAMLIFAGATTYAVVHWVWDWTEGR